MKKQEGLGFSGTEYRSNNCRARSFFTPPFSPILRLRMLNTKLLLFIYLFNKMDIAESFHASFLSESFHTCLRMHMRIADRWVDVLDTFYSVCILRHEFTAKGMSTSDRWVKKIVKRIRDAVNYRSGL